MFSRTKNHYGHYFFLLFCGVLFTHSLSAQKQAVAIPAIEKALADNQLAEAENLVQKKVGQFRAARQADSLTNYIFYVGKVAQLKLDTDKGVQKVQALLDDIGRLSPSPLTMRQAFIEAGEYYGFAGKNSLAYKANREALKYTLASPTRTPGQLGKIESNLGAFAQRMGDINLSGQHHRQALQYLLSDPKPDPESLYISYNSMGGILWYASKLDSSLTYFNQAIATLKRTEPSGVNQHYRPAMVLNNVSAIYNAQGKTTEAIAALKACIQHLKTFISSKEPHLKKNSAISLQFEATDNLAGIYKELGDYKQAHALLTYSYQQKQQQLGKADPAIFISKILLGQLYYAMKEHDKALRFLGEGLAMIDKADGDYTFWKADACNTLALLHDEKKNPVKATLYYEQADSLYEATLQGEYDNIYLEFLGNAALFYAENKDAGKAMRKARKAYDYIVKTQGETSLPASNQLLNLAEVNYLSGNFREAANYSKRSLSAVNAAISSTGNILDSIKTELKKPKAVLQKAKAEYALLQKKDPVILRSMAAELVDALAILERRKTILRDGGDIGLLMADQSNLIKFIEQVYSDLFKLTNDRSYLDKLMELHESALYNRIRARLDKNDSLQFAHVPAPILAKERMLKSAISTSLEGGGSYDQKMQVYFAAIEAWSRFQEKLKKEYPRYYQMRYASLFKTVENVQQLVPEKTTLVRYIFSGNELFVLVADRQRSSIIPLVVKDLEQKITALSAQAYDARQMGETLVNLYQQLWSPIAGKVCHPKLVVIPDGILYNLSFEILTPERIHSFRELASKSLLAKHSFSYNYSLFLIEPSKKPSSYNQSFVGFAPGFDDHVKQAYRSAASQAVSPDEGYLSLLPQPFAIELATKTREMFGGDVYLHGQSTKTSFKENAGNHQIIHIGTHGESDNLFPEFSRLVFAKSGGSSAEDNYLYLPEIYNCDLRAGLSVLTACESGKPGYQDGEGMISLAHAFYYAGSESILTGLWKIDEQTSSRLLEFFYKNLLDGLPKDEALRLAKLTYLQEAEGRTLSPQYWAGLVLMGDTSPIALQPAKNSYAWWIIGAAALVIAFIFFFNWKKSQVARTPSRKNANVM